MSARFEFGRNYLEIANFRYFPEVDVYNTLYDLRVQSYDGRFFGTGDCEDDFNSIKQFALELQEMYDLKRDHIEFHDGYGHGADILFSLYKNGHINVEGEIGCFSHTLQFDFEARQTSLPPFIKSLKELIEEYNEI